MKKGLYQWVDHRTHGWTTEDVKMGFLDAMSRNFFPITKKYSLLFLEEKFVVPNTMRGDSTPVKVCKMLLTDSGKYKNPTIIWVLEHWVMSLSSARY